MYTKSYLRNCENWKETIRKQVELGKGKEISSTDGSIEDKEVKEAQPNLTTGVLCVITTEELDFRLSLDS